MHAVKILYFSVEDYLEMELQREQRHEYVRGEMLAMTGGSVAHNLIALNLAVALRTALRGTPCRVYVNDVKLRIEAADCFFYPDVMVSCVEPGRLQDCYVVTDAKLVIEVLSPGTIQRGREFKRLAYRQLPGLQDYLLVAQNSRSVTIYRRLPDGWEQERYGPGEVVELRSLGLSLPISQIYEEVLE
ncbi:MAG: Uma2 family endonuclease [Candidatus Competibacteraceae bacterium]